MLEIIFLLILGFLFVIFASIQDLKKREVANWLSFSLIIFAIAFRFFYCLFSETNFAFFWQGLFGLGIFLILGNLFYYSRIFAGGDAKLMIALGAILPLSTEFFNNVKIFALFLISFLFFGIIYGVAWSVTLAIKNYKKVRKEFFSLQKKNKKYFYLGYILAFLFLGFVFIDAIFIAFAILIFLTPFIFIFAKSVDETCMIKKISTKNLTEGDWLYQNVKIGKKLIKADWEGLNERDILLLRKHKKEILIRQGIPFVPVFFFSMIAVAVYVL